MHSDIQAVLYEAEDHYLNNAELQLFKHHTNSLAQRLEIYERLREQEVEIFQPIADQLAEVFHEEDQHLLQEALKHWLAVLRCCAMAMLLKNPEFLEQRLLGWLTDVIQAHQMQSLENTVYQLLKTRLKEVLSAPQMDVFQPFLYQAQKTLLGSQFSE